MYCHYGDVIMTRIASQITSLTVVYSIVYSGADQRKHQSSASLAFVQGIHRDRWIPRTKGQLRGKCFHLMTSSCVSWVPNIMTTTSVAVYDDKVGISTILVLFFSASILCNISVAVISFMPYNNFSFWCATVVTLPFRDLKSILKDVLH